VIPEEELIKRKYIDKITRSSIYLNQDSDTNIGSWTKEYLFDYTKPDLVKIKALFKI
jgi:hypothetical protein